MKNKNSPHPHALLPEGERGEPYPAIRGGPDYLLTLFNQGRYSEMENHARAMTMQFPTHGMGWKALGTALLQQGKSTEALTPMQQAAILLPADAGVHNNLGSIFNEQGRFLEAEASLLRALQLNPHFAEAYYNLGNALQAQGRLAEAEASYRRAVVIKPDYAEAHSNLAVNYKAQNRLIDVEASYRRALAIKPKAAELHNSLGMLFKQQGRLADAETSYRLALEIKPEYVEALVNLGNTLKAQNRPHEAEACYRHALALKPDLVEALNYLGNALQDQDRLNEAGICFRQALKINPGYAEAHINLGNTLQEQGRLLEAEASFRRALEIKPDYVGAHRNLGNIFHEQGRLLDAEESYRRALEIDPECAETHINLAFHLLGSCQFAAGWKEYAWRTSRLNEPEQTGLLWNECLPLNLTNKRIMLLKDQGLGDELFFLRFVAELKKRGAWVAYVADSRLVPMIRRAEWVDCVVAEQELLTEPTHVVCNIGDLPRMLGMSSVADIPAAVPLSVLPEKQQEVAARLVPHRNLMRPLIGITWQGGTPKSSGEAGLYKQIPAGLLGAALRGKQATFVIVQRNPRPEDSMAFATALGAPVLDLSDLNNDLEDMLALMSQLDDYIGVGNTNMHLRGCVGKTAHVLLPHSKDFRWMMHGNNSPWFPGFSVYRAAPGGVWDEALAQLGSRFD